ncbi:hypothetical protein B2J67_07430, partial [Vibrio cholerae]
IKYMESFRYICVHPYCWYLWHQIVIINMTVMQNILIALYKTASSHSWHSMYLMYLKAVLI